MEMAATRPSAEASPGAEASLPSSAVGATAAPRAVDAPRRCFICLTDEEPTDPRGSWVDPCPCTLEAHQDCMLAWVIDCERSNKPLKCPVCKSTIEMEGPWDPIASLHDAIQRKFTRASPFILITGMSVGLQFSLQMYGAMALWTFAGKDALMRFALGPEMTMDGRSTGVIGLAKSRIVNALVLMNVAPALLVSQLLPGLSNRYLVQSASAYGIYAMIRNDNFLEWPPSPQLVMVALPIVRKLYFNLWRDFVLPYEMKLNRRILGLPPPEGNQNGGGDVNRGGAERNAEGGLVGFLQNILDALDPDEEEGQEDAIHGAHQAIVREEVHVAADRDDEGDIMVELLIEEVDEEAEEDAAGDDEQENRRRRPEQAREAAPHPPPPQAHQHEAPQAPPARRIGLGGLLANVSNSIVGALLLPSVSFAMGEALRLVLPRSWTAPLFKSRWPFGQPANRPGLLQQQWGRSLVGGCLYVVLKDAIRVYSKSRKVAAMKNRRVKNVERPRRRS